MPATNSSRVIAPGGGENGAVVHEEEVVLVVEKEEVEVVVLVVDRGGDNRKPLANALCASRDSLPTASTTLSGTHGVSHASSSCSPPPLGRCGVEEEEVATLRLKSDGGVASR